MARHWRIRHKLLSGFVLVIAIIALLLAGTFRGLWSYHVTMKSIDSKLAELKAAERHMTDVARLAAPDADKSEQTETLLGHIKDARRSLDDYDARLRETLDRQHDPNNALHESGLVEELRKKLDQIEGMAVNPDTQVSASVNTSKRDNRRQAEMQGEIDKLRASALDLRDTIYRDLGQSIGLSRRNYQYCLWMVLSTSGAGVLLLAGLLRFFYGWVFNPVRDLQQGAGRVAQGDFEHRIDVRSGDEMEDLAAAFNDMTNRLRDMYRDLERQVNERSRQLVRSERLASVGFLAAGVAHEINNPLASIAFCSEALEARLGELLEAPAPVRKPGLFQKSGPAAAPARDTEVVVKYLKMIQEEAFRCKRITERLLEFSRGSERRREPADLAELVQSVLDVAQHLQNGKGKQVLFDPPPVRVVACVSAQEIKSVILNLVVNALDSMEEGGRLMIRLALRDGMAELVFTDTGCGMTEEVLENIFEPFFTRSRTGKGTGLGLTISHRIVSQHGGEIDAESPGPNRGATFTVRLPLQQAAAAEGTEALAA